MSNYMKKYGFQAWPLYELGVVFKRVSHFSNREKITVYLPMRSAFTLLIDALRML